MSPSTRRIEQITVIFVLVLIAVGCFVVLRPFLAALLWATILTISTWPAFRWWERVLGGRTTLAAAIMTAILAIALLVPLVVLGGSLADNFSRFAGTVLSAFTDGPPSPPPWIETIPLIGPDLKNLWLYFDEDTTRFAAAARDYVRPVTEELLTIGKSIGGGLLDLTLSVIAAFFFYRDGAHGARRLRVALDKLAGERGHHLLSVAENTVNGVVYGMIGTAIAQGAVAALGMWLAGIPGAVFLGVLTAMLSFVPMGPPSVWFPSAVWLFSRGQVEWGVFMAAWGLFFISTVDNFIRPYFISLGSALPLLLVFLGVLGGIVSFGLLGVFIGPTLLAVGYTLVREWSQFVEVKEGDEPSPGGNGTATEKAEVETAAGE